MPGPGRQWGHGRLEAAVAEGRLPERLIDEKTDLLNRLLEERGRLFFTHDHEVDILGTPAG